MADPFAPYPQPGRGYTPVYDPNNPHFARIGLGIVAGPGAVNPAAPTVPGGVAPLPTYGGSPAAGSKPTVPKPGKSAAQATNQNRINLPALQNLAGALNAFNLGQVTNQFEAGLPGYRGIIGQEARNIETLLGGQLSPEEMDMLRTNAAEFGITSGTGLDQDSLAGYRGLRSLFLTSKDRQRAGSEMLTGALGRIPRAPIYDPATGFVTPQQQQDAALLAQMIAAAPDPELAFQRALQLARAGQASGAASVGGVPGGGGGGAANPTLSMLTNLLSKYMPGGGGGGSTTTPSQTGGIPAPPGTQVAGTTTPGWGWTSSHLPGQPPYGGTDLPASVGAQQDYLYS